MTTTKLCGFEKRTVGGALLRCTRPAEDCKAGFHVFRFIYSDDECVCGARLDSSECRQRAHLRGPELRS